MPVGLRMLRVEPEMVPATESLAVPVFPVFLSGTGRAMPKGAIVPLPLCCIARVGPALHCTTDRRAFVSLLEQRIAALGRR